MKDDMFASLCPVNIWETGEWDEGGECQLWGAEEELPGADRAETHPAQNTDVFWGGIAGIDARVGQCAVELHGDRVAAAIEESKFFM